MRAKGMISVLAGLGIATAGLVYVPAAQAAPQGCDSRTNNSVSKLLTCVTLDGVLEHEEAFQEIADDNDGNRLRAIRATTPRRLRRGAARAGRLPP